MAEGEAVMEGFLCPLCMKDLGDVIQLQVHFDESHSKEDQAFVQSIKELFGKAKKRILSEEEAGSGEVVQATRQLRLAPDRTDSCHPVSGIRLDLHTALQPDLLPSKSHTELFTQIRSSRVDRYASETNRLIVRLDKLLTNLPGDPSKRREHEQRVVAWAEGSFVPACPACTRSFTPVRRRHHCRLCGAVMCQDCSQFVDFQLCRRLVSPSTLSSFRPQVAGEAGAGRDPSTGSPARPSSVFKLRRSGSRESLGSVLSIVDKGAREEFRCCGYCRALLLHRDGQVELATQQPIITQFYSKLRESQELGLQLSPQYLSMYNSLMTGDTTYHSADAKLLRVKLLKVAENIDLMSKKIAGLGLDQLPEGAAEAGGLPRRFHLQNQVRRASVNFIKETLVGLPSLPSEEELVKLQEKRKEEIAAKVEEERRRAAEARLKFQIMQERRRSDTPRVLKISPTASKFNQSNVSYASGFVLSSSSQAHLENSVNDDPLVQQMILIRGYIKQARDQNRFDEVSMLESNLAMLQEEFQKQNPDPGQAVGEDRTRSLPRELDRSPEHSGYVSFEKTELAEAERNGDINNPFHSDSDDEYDASGKNPFSE